MRLGVDDIYELSFASFDILSAPFRFCGLNV